MSTSQQAAQQTVTAANIMSEEKSYRIVRFAVTGQIDADVMAGIGALLVEIGINGNHRLQQRIFEYLAHRSKDAADGDDAMRNRQILWEQRMQTMQSPAPVSDQSILGQLYGSSGGSALPGAPQQIAINSAWAAQMANGMSAVGVNDKAEESALEAMVQYREQLKRIK